ncbi:hypothetical protein [Natrialba sp. SSL1]|uniref:hypothetical protein n=1 Tax=Natrialba sp. SSL1 TaxID=1869245 RepID=UPI0008F8D028|nr:hypothetical protein [Natrialba sp. SSL1]OIB57073.1 hypothetical protein BBD46_15130 [Natrialba sp. SSL1]
MVGDSTRPPRETDEPQRDRGQVILIGAIALAFIILGIVVVFNGVLYTETISSSATSQSAADAAVTQHELEKSIAGIVHRSNIGTFDGDYDDHVDTLSGKHQQVTANSGPVITGIDLDSAEGRATSSVGEPIEDFDDLNNRNLSDGADDIQVGHFILEVEPDSSGELTVESPESAVTISDGEGIVGSELTRIDLVAGTVNGVPHPDVPRVFDPGESYDEVIVEYDDEIEGTYEIVTKGNNLDGGLNKTEDDGAWAVEATITYESNGISFGQKSTFPVYGGDS